MYFPAFVVAVVLNLFYVYIKAGAHSSVVG
jgi:hypothetical protein